jgi:glycosyltransferase involved in cell wall biosynthesis
MNVLVFEPECSGHRMYLYTSVLVKALLLAGNKVVLVTAAQDVERVKQHFGDCESLVVVEAIRHGARNGSTIVSKVVGHFMRFASFYHSVRRYKTEHEVNRIVIPFYDDLWKAHALLNLVVSINIPILAILLKPTFYRRDGNGFPARVKQFVNVLLFRRIVGDKDVVTLFMLDQSAVRSLHTNSNASGIKKVDYLPDIGVPTDVDLQQMPTKPVARNVLHLRSEGKIILMFGDISFRKGLTQLVNSIENAGQSPISALIVGRPGEAEKRYLDSKFELLRTGRIIVVPNFVIESDVHLYFCAADVVWLGYQNFLHSSGVLIQAAHFHRPVVGCRVGKIAEDITRFQLGELIDIESHLDIIEKLNMVVSTDYSEGMRRYKDEHSASDFAHRVIKCLN